MNDTPHSERDDGADYRPPSYADISTFLGAPHTKIENVSEDSPDVAVVGVPYDSSVTNRPGARYGPRGLRTASAQFASIFHSSGETVNLSTKQIADYSKLRIQDCGDVGVFPNDAARTHERVETAVRKVASHATPVVLGGDHSVTYPSFVGFAEAVDEQVGLIHLDAHPDLVKTSSVYGDDHHGTTVAQIGGSEYTQHEHHAMLGIRGHTSPSAVETMKGNGIHVTLARDVRERGLAPCLRDALEHVTSAVDSVYLTVDIDVVDPAYAPGTGTPTPGGLTSAELLRTMELLGAVPEIGAIDLVEVAPPFDSSDVTQLLGADALVRFLESKFYESVS